MFLVKFWICSEPFFSGRGKFRNERVLHNFVTLFSRILWKTSSDLTPDALDAIFVHGFVWRFRKSPRERLKTPSAKKCENYICSTVFFFRNPWKMESNLTPDALDTIFVHGFARRFRKWPREPPETPLDLRNRGQNFRAKKNAKIDGAEKTRT